ncbi:MAG: PEP-CTERM sorting domain-containing protein [Armatimonadota bacterium]|nr:PEP-CTERM sorting domain-containing protein [Armatimonadota bacterium]
MKWCVVAVCLFAALFAVRTPAAADWVASEAAFTAQLAPGYYLEEFNQHPWTTDAPILFPQLLSQGSWSYVVSADGALKGAPSSSGWGYVSTISENDYILVVFNDPKPTAVGGWFFVTDSSGAPTPGRLTVHLSNGQTLEVTANEYQTFTGYIGADALEWMEISLPGGGAGDEEWRALDHLYVGYQNTGVTPEPASVALLGVGLALAARRRKRRA